MFKSLILFFLFLFFSNNAFSSKWEMPEKTRPDDKTISYYEDKKAEFMSLLLEAATRRPVFMAGKARAPQTVGRDTP